MDSWGNVFFGTRGLINLIQPFLTTEVCKLLGECQSLVGWAIF